MAAKHDYVQLGVNKWFKSDLSIIKEFTQMVQRDDDEESQEETKELEEGEEPEEAPVDPNSLKFIPDLIHLSK